MPAVTPFQPVLHRPFGPTCVSSKTQPVGLLVREGPQLHQLRCNEVARLPRSPRSAGRGHRGPRSPRAVLGDGALELSRRFLGGLDGGGGLRLGRRVGYALGVTCWRGA